MLSEYKLVIYVQTIKPDIESNDWNKEVVSMRKWNVYGQIIKYHNSYGCCYDVLHEDGTIGSYEPRELRLIDPCNMPSKGYML